MVMIVMLGRQHIPVYRRNTKELVMNVDLRFWGPGTTWLTAVLPSGGSLPEGVWRRRYSFLLGLTWFHAGIIALVGPVLGTVGR